MVLSCLALAYLFAQLPFVRGQYAAWDKLAHAGVFALAYLALAWAMDWRPVSVAILGATMGAAVEVHQFFLPGFTPSLADWVADVVGIALVAAPHTLWVWIKNRRLERQICSARQGLARPYDLAAPDGGRVGQ